MDDAHTVWPWHGMTKRERENCVSERGEEGGRIRAHLFGLVSFYALFSRTSRESCLRLEVVSCGGHGGAQSGEEELCVL